MDNEANKSNGSGLFKLSSEIADIFLDTIWRDNKNVRHSWHIFFFCLLVVGFVFFVARLLFAGVMQQSPFYTEIYRICRFSIVAILLASFIGLGFQYYKNLLMTGHDLRFENIIFFAIGDIIIFGGLYQLLYFWHPEFFIYQSTPLLPSATVVDVSLSSTIVVFEFYLYSACVNFSITYPRIISNSFAVSIVNVAQMVIWLALVGLFIATFVQLAAKRKK